MPTISNSKSVAQALVEILIELGVEYAFGVSGRTIATLWTELEQSQIKPTFRR